MISHALEDFAKVSDLTEYMVDSLQRSVLYTDIIRKRGNIYLDHLEKGQPPVLVFDYDVIVDGRDLDRPVNYCLVKIIDKKKKSKKNDEDGHPKRPVIVIDPRAGHGPGIGGSKEDSEIGLALEQGHPVYFVMFFTNPIPNQTIADVQNAEVYFVEEVKKRHKDAENPAIVGNCQAGWAAALVAADRPDICGPLVLNGSPLSYWGGVDGSNPMRYRGGLLGGVWLNSFLSDLGNGHFDGANLVMNMENLNPANTYWSKYYHVYENVDTEEERFLEFERWWGGFFMMTKEEIHFIVDSLFVGNRLERGKLKLDENGNNLDIKNIKDPVVVFASGGDNITPPQQALNWIAKVYKATDEIKRNNQVIIYLLHEDIGHLGIFVSTKVAKKEHREIFGTVEMFSYLAPGLYEMKIDETEKKSFDEHYKVSFEEREIEDILKLDDGFEDEADFLHVATISKNLDKYYNAYLNPIVSKISNEKLADFLRQTHPLRVQRYIFSDLNPFMLPFKTGAKLIKKNRVEATKENSFRQIEKKVSDSISDSLDMYRDLRDLSHEYYFKTLYGNPFIQSFYKESFKDNIWSDEENNENLGKTHKVSEARLISKMDKGGFKEGLLRIMIAITSADEVFDKSEFNIAQSITRSHPKLSKLKPSEVREIASEQARLLQIDREKALKTLPRLIHYKKDRKEALEIAEKIALADAVVTKEEKDIIEKIASIMKI